jgi:UDP-3-O-[3-hydroxymyristoyl] N-acetylglucosamine deacetylase
MTSVTLTRRDGAITFEQGSRRAPLSRLTVQRTDSGVALADGGGLEVDLAEHLLAAFAGLGIRSGVTAKVEGAELPILDGGAAMFAEALIALELTARPAEPAPMVVNKPGSVSSGNSCYTFEVAEATSLSIDAVFDRAAIGIERASWDGSPHSFLASIATARTFGFQADARALWRQGRALLAARSDDPRAIEAFRRAVIVFDEAGRLALPGQAPPAVGELGRHKLLDLIGDFAFYGGPPQGHVSARRPGHTASHQIIRDALALGIVSQR